ncbi:MAG: hypothetical protein RL701_6132 [Pseudomonadota bacterium]|jgi:hypothetical protein
MSATDNTSRLVSATTSRTRVVVLLALVIALALYLLLAITFRIGTFPALHGDEAYFGLTALDMLQHGLQSPHASNTYTGPLEAAWVALIFAVSQPSVAALRSSALLANGSAWLLWAWLRFRRGGPRAALPILLLIAASPLLLFMARLAWEVSALQGILLAGLLGAVASRERSVQPSRWTSACYLCAAWLGVSSHFIFLTVLMALFLGAVAAVRADTSDREAPTVLLTAAGLALGVVLFIVKPRLSVDHFAAHAIAYSVVWALAPLLVLALLEERWLTAIAVLGLFAVAKPAPRALKFLTVLSALWFLGSGLGLGLLDLMAGPVFYKGFAAWAQPWWLVTTLYALAACVLLAALHEIVRVLKTSPAQNAPVTERWLASAIALWPLCLLASGTFKTSLRYYLPIYPVLLWFIADRLERRAAWRGLRPSVIAAALASLLLWMPLLQGMRGQPLKYRMGNRLENAHHYLPLDALLAHARELRVCHFDGDHFLREPLTFLARVQPYPCDDQRVLRVRYTLDRPPYWAAELASEQTDP